MATVTDKDREAAQAYWDCTKLQDMPASIAEAIAQAREEGRQEERERCDKAIADATTILVALKDDGLAKLAEAADTKIGDVV